MGDSTGNNPARVGLLGAVPFRELVRISIEVDTFQPRRVSQVGRPSDRGESRKVNRECVV